MPRRTSGRSLCERFLIVGYLAAAACAVAASAAASQPDVIKYSHQSDVIYGRKYGLALTMEVFTPEKNSGLGVVWIVSSGGTSSREQALTDSFEKRIGPLLDRGYVVFAVVHGNGPAFQVQDYVSDARRAVRFIRHHAKQAVGVFFPPADLTNYGEASLDIVDVMRKRGGPVDPSFQFYAADDKTGARTLIADPEAIRRLLREASPVSHVSPDDPPTILIHGDQDRVVPLQQSRQLADRLTEAKVAVRLVTQSGKAHAWPGWEADSTLIAAWFNIHLKAAR
jgi:acetyl esterase/lipase